MTTADNVIIKIILQELLFLLWSVVKCEFGTYLQRAKQLLLDKLRNFRKFEEI